MKDLVLILSNEEDASAQRVADQIRARGQRFLYLDTAYFPSQVCLNACIHQGQWEGFFMYKGQKYCIDEIKSVYLRRPNHYAVSDTYPEILQNVLENEADRGFGGMLRSLNCFWMNHIDAQRAAGYKPVQLQIALRNGFVIPDTLITNDQEEVRAFYSKHDGNIICKPLHGGYLPGGADIYHIAYTSRVPAELLQEPHLSRIRLTANLFQNYIKKQVELRCTVIGTQVLTVEIQSQHSMRSRDDWRASYADLRYRVCDLPKDIEHRCIQVVRDQKLWFGATTLS